MRPPASLLLCTLLAAAVALVLGAEARAQQRCPTISFLGYAGVVYASEEIPASVSILPGDLLGEGTIDEPDSEDGCKRKRDEPNVLRAGDIDPAVAVAVEGRSGSLFVLGGRCSGYEGQTRWDCLLRPLVFDGKGYTGEAYPATPAPRGTVRLGESLGTGELDGASASVVALEGVDPRVALGIEGRPNEAFLASGVCPYERFANTEPQDDLGRCLRAPLWLVFDPVGAKVGDTITARADRVLRAELEGAEVALVRLAVAADVLPADRSEAVPIGVVSIDGQGGATLPFGVPDVAEGLYEAVVTCAQCGPAFGGDTAFAAGSIVVFEKKGGGSGRPVLIGAGAVFLLLIPVAFIAWRRGWHRGRARPSG